MGWQTEENKPAKMSAADTIKSAKGSGSDAIKPAQVFRHVAFALVVGVVGAVASIVLSVAVDGAGALSRRFPWLLFALPVLGVVSIGLYRVVKLPDHLATDTVIEHLRANRRISPALAPSILVGTVLTVLGGGSVGKEAAALQMGASLGSTVGRPFKLAPPRKGNPDNPKGYAAAAGMIACFSALFFAPLGSTVFVLELARFDRALLRHLPTMLLAAFVAFGIAHVVGIGDYIPPAEAPAFSWGVIALCLLVGLSCAVAGALFSASLRTARRVLRAHVRYPALAVFAGGLLIAGVVLLFGWQAFEGTGSVLLQQALSGQAQSFDFAIKALLTVLALGFGFKGGEIMPMFTIGALLGCVLGPLTGQPAGFAAALGLAAFFAAASRCPLAAFVMGTEVLGWSLMPYLAVSVAIAYAGSHDVGVFGRGAASWIARRTRAAAKFQSSRRGGGVQ